MLVLLPVRLHQQKVSPHLNIPWIAETGKRFVRATTSRSGNHRDTKYTSFHKDQNASPHDQVPQEQYSTMLTTHPSRFPDLQHHPRALSRRPPHHTPAHPLPLDQELRPDPSLHPPHPPSTPPKLPIPDAYPNLPPAKPSILPPRRK